MLRLVVRSNVSGTRGGRGHGIGRLVDWWAQTSTVPESVLQQSLPDGRHYPSEASLAFLNLWLNAIVDRAPY